MGLSVTKLLLTAIACVILPACATNVGGTVDSVPTWLGGMPQGRTAAARNARIRRVAKEARRTCDYQVKIGAPSVADKRSFNGRNLFLA